MHDQIRGPFYLWEINLYHSKNKFILIYFIDRWVSFKQFKKLPVVTSYHIPSSFPSNFFLFSIFLKKILRTILNINHIF